MKVLNLYAGIGGNRKLWEDVDVTAVEWDEETANVYQDYFPEDKVIVADAHQYLLDHFDEFDFIWSSPPCPSHSRINWSRQRDLEYPDMRLYQEILFLDNWAECKWVVENVIPYYEPLIQGRVIGKHMFWSNFNIGKYKPTASRRIRSDQIPELQELTGFDITGYGITNKRQKLRNCVNPETGKYILGRARDIVAKSNTQQVGLFDD